MRKNLVAAAPLGIFLSGGIDSSLLTLLADQFQNYVRSISVNFDEASFDEQPYQQMVLENAHHVQHISYGVTEDMFWEKFDNIFRAMDQPSIDGVNTYFITQCAKADGLKEVLSGLGAGKIFGGYISFELIKWVRRLRQLPFKKTLGRWADSFQRKWESLGYLEWNIPMGITFFCVVFLFLLQFLMFCGFR